MILPEDDITASNEVSYTDRLGLPKIPRANNQALAAINAITRILEEKVYNRDGDTASGEHNFEQLSADILTAISGDITSLTARTITAESASAPVITATSQLAAANANIDNANIPALTAALATLTTATGTKADFNEIEAAVANAHELEAYILKVTKSIETADFYAATGSGEKWSTDRLDANTSFIEDLQTTTLTVPGTATFNKIVLNNNDLTSPVTNYIEYDAVYNTQLTRHEFNMGFVPDELDYTIILADTVIDATIKGNVSFLTDQKQYEIADQQGLVNPAPYGTGYPEHSSSALFDFTMDGTTLVFTGYQDIDYANEADFKLLVRARRYPRTS